MERTSRSFNSVQNYTTLKLSTKTAKIENSFNSVQNYTTLKPQIQKSDSIF